LIASSVVDLFKIFYTGFLQPSSRWFVYAEKNNSFKFPTDLDLDQVGINDHNAAILLTSISPCILPVGFGHDFKAFF